MLRKRFQSRLQQQMIGTPQEVASSDLDGDKIDQIDDGSGRGPLVCPFSVRRDADCWSA